MYITYISYTISTSLSTVGILSVSWHTFTGKHHMRTLQVPYEYFMSTLWVPYDYLVLQLPKILLHIGVVTQVMYSDTIQ